MKTCWIVWEQKKVAILSISAWLQKAFTKDKSLRWNLCTSHTISFLHRRDSLLSCNESTLAVLMKKKQILSVWELMKLYKGALNLPWQKSSIKTQWQGYLRHTLTNKQIIQRQTRGV